MEARQQSRYQFGALPGKVKEWEATGIGIFEQHHEAEEGEVGGS